MGLPKAYETEIADGVRKARGRGPTREASIAGAIRQWEDQSPGDHNG